MGFQPKQGGSKTYYSLLIDAARAEVEPMAEPRNPAHVLGVGTQIESVNGPVFAAYFAASRERFDAQPNYKSGLFVLVDGAVYSVKAEHIDTTIRRGFSTREFTLLRGDRPQRSVVIAGRWYREPFRVGQRRRCARGLHARDRRRWCANTPDARGSRAGLLLHVTAKLLAHRRQQPVAVVRVAARFEPAV